MLYWFQVYALIASIVLLPFILLYAFIGAGRMAFAAIRFASRKLRGATSSKLAVPKHA